MLAIRSKRLENTEKAKIDYEKGTLFIENTLENKGIIAGHTFIMKESSKEAVSLINYG